MGMWAYYRKAAKYMQPLILLVCFGFYRYSSITPMGLLMVFVAMQAFTVIGAWWGCRLKRRFEAHSEILPLQRR